MIQQIGLLERADVCFLADFYSPMNIFEQLSAIYTIARARVNSFKILLPYFPTGTMERVDTEGQVATAATLARMLSNTPHTASGPAELVIYDIHALSERFFFGDGVIPFFKTGTKLLKARLTEEQDVALAFPDEGAWKRFKVMFSEKQFEHPIICSKVRGADGQRMVTIKEGDPRGKHVVIVDDLIHSGGTLIECAKVLLAAGAVKASAYATHGVLEKMAWLKFIDGPFHRVWITDSCPESSESINGKGPFEVLSLAPSLARAILA